MSRRLTGQVAVVTGAGRGFGQAIARALAQQGAAVALLSRSAGEIAQVAAGINGEGGRALPLACDVSDPGQVARACAAVLETLGTATLVVSNAGVPGPFGPVWEVDLEQWWRAQAVHILAPQLLMRHLMPGMIAARRGRVIVISAMASRLTLPFLSAYSVGKTAARKLVEMAAAEAAPHNVQVFAVEPGFVVTRLGEDTYNDPEARRWMPHMLRYLDEGRARPDPQADLGRTAERCVRLAAGDYDALSGRYMELPDPIDEWQALALSTTGASGAPGGSPSHD